MRAMLWALPSGAVRWLRLRAMLATVNSARNAALVSIPREPTSVAQSQAACEVPGRFNKSFLTACSAADPVTKRGEAVFQKLEPAAQGQPHCAL